MLAPGKLADSTEPDCYGYTPLLRAVGNGHEGVVKVLLGRDDVNPTNQICTAIHPSGGLLAMGTMEWSNYSSGGTTSTPTNQIFSKKHRSGVLLTMGTKEW